MRLSYLTLPLLLAACASDTTNATADAPPQGRHAERIAAAQPSGPPENCIELRNIRSSRVLSDQIIDFELIDGRIMRNVLPYRCSGLGFSEAFTYSTSLTRLCSVDIITVLNQGGGPARGATCGLGQFQPVTFAAR
jgi:hypothetical protein